MHRQLGGIVRRLSATDLCSVFWRGTLTVETKASVDGQDQVLGQECHERKGNGGPEQWVPGRGDGIHGACRKAVHEAIYGSKQQWRHKEKRPFHILFRHRQSLPGASEKKYHLAIIWTHYKVRGGYFVSVKGEVGQEPDQYHQDGSEIEVARKPQSPGSYCVRRIANEAAAGEKEAGADVLVGFESLEHEPGPFLMTEAGLEPVDFHLVPSYATHATGRLYTS